MFSINTGQVLKFPCNNWLSKSEPPYKCSVELMPSTESGQASLCRYNIVTYTSDKRGAGTDANVNCVIFGDTGATSVLPLENSA